MCTHTTCISIYVCASLCSCVLIYFNFDLKQHVLFAAAVSYFSRVFKIHTNDYNIFFSALKDIFQITQQTKQYGYVSVTCMVVPDVSYLMGALFMYFIHYNNL